MSRVAKWKLEKTKVKVVFRLQFHATHVPQAGWDKLFISFIPADSGKATAKTTKANVRNGACKWGDPIYETTRLLQDSKSKQYDVKLYKFVVAMGSSRSSILGEASINLADFADALKPSIIDLPLHGCNCGTILHVTIQLLTSKTGFRNTAKTFYAASIFFEIRNQFGDFQPDLEQKQKYAAWKAADIRKALKEGRKPIPGPADGDKDLSILSSTSSGEYDLELSRSDPAIKPALEPDQLHQSYDEIPPSPSNNSPSLPSYPTASYPSHDFHPPPSTNRSENSTYSQPYHHQPYPREPQQHFPQNYPSHEISSPSYPNFQSYPSFTETSLPDAPSNHHSYNQGSDATYSTLSASTTTNYPSTTHYNSSSRNGTGLEAAPNSVQMYEYDSNYQPPPEKIAEAHKAARFAVGALAFDDISVAVDHLKNSLELLTNPSASQHKGDESGRRRKRGDDLDESLSRRTERRRRRGKATNGEATEARQGEARQGDGEATGAARDEQTESARDEQTKSARDEERVTRIDMSTSSNNDAGFFQNKRCKCGKKIEVYISESEKNPGKLYFKCANKACDYFARGVAPTGNGSNIQKSGYDYDFARNNEVVNILEQLEANQRERLEAIKFMMLTTIVMIGFTILVVLLK